jgi:23S rRNA (cytosine1962-C5)-methyltransferase
VLTVRVSWKAVERAAAGHPWLFASDVTDRGDAQPGDVVQVSDPKGRVIGVAHYSSTSQITLRLLERGNVELDAGFSSAFFRRRIEAAASFRRRVVRDSDAYRLVYSEADLIPGLIVDRYANYFVVQTLTQGMERAQPEIVAALQELFQPAGILARNDSTIRKKENLPLETKVLAGEIPGRVDLRMNGLAWHANLTGGQKTGIFLDQRENYMAARQHAHGKALDCFTSTGGFALHIAPACERVEAIDSSAEALSTAEVNRAANSIANVEFKQADAFEMLAGLTAGKRSFDTVVLDPPAFAKTRQNVTAALEAYKEINLRALKLLGPGGVLVTCSCSHHVSEAALLGVVADAANITGRTLRVLERRTQAADHPILLTVPETHYLKCLVFQVL